MLNQTKGAAMAARYRRSLFLSAAVIALAGGVGSAQMVRAQSVAGSGDISPAPAQPQASPWTVSGDIRVGNTVIATDSDGDGKPDNITGQLDIAGGATASDVFGYIGYGAGSNGLVNVSGTDGSSHVSTWTSSKSIHVGESGSGTLNITNGGKVASGTTGGNYTFIGNKAGSVGVVKVSGVAADGSRSSLITMDRLTVGESGNGTLNILDGGFVSSEYTMTIGNILGSAGLVEVSGVNAVTHDRSTLVVAHNLLWVGGDDDGTLNIKAGGLVDVTGVANGSVPGVVIGDGANSHSFLSVDGIDQTTQMRSTIRTFELDVGSQGQGQLDITNGGLVSTTEIDLGLFTGAVGVMNVDGVAAGTNTASTATVGGPLYVGYQGKGTLNITNGGVTNVSGLGYIGYLAGSQGAVTVSGTDINGNASTWTNSDELYVGRSGTGTLTITDGGAVSDTTGFIGYSAGGVGTALISGTDASGTLASTWTNSSDLVIGQNGNGKLTIENGAKVINETGYIGAGYVGTGINDHSDVIVSGHDSGGHASTWTNNAGLIIGDNGTGSLTIQDGGVVNTAQTANIGFNSDNLGSGVGTGVGSVLVTGRDINGHASTWNVGSTLAIGGAANNNTLDIEDGGVVNSGAATIGDDVGSRGTATVSGRDANGNASTWTNGNMYVGYQSDGTLNIADGGIVDSAIVYVGYDAGATGALHLNGDSNGRGVLETGSITKGGGTAVLDLNGGILRATGNTNAFLSGFTNLSAGTGGAWFDSNGFTITVGTVFTGSLSLNKLGQGTLILTGANTYAGGTTIGGGTLQVGNGSTTGSITGNVSDNGTLAFNRSDAVTFDGIISGSGAVTKAGAGVLTLTNGNSYTGGTTISAGTLQLGNGGTTGSLAGNIVDNGTLTFNRSDTNLVLAGNITGTGKVNQIGSGTTTLTGTSSFGATTVSLGQLRIANGGKVTSSGTLSVSGATGKTATLTVDGVGSRFINTAVGSSSAGGPGSGILNI